MSEESIKLSVFGRDMLAIRDGQCWKLFYLGAEGKRRVATDIVIEDGVTRDQLVQALADLLHEWARPGYEEVKILK